MTREQWMENMLLRVRPLFSQLHAPLPKDITIGNVMIHELRGSGMAIGRCYGSNPYHMDRSALVTISPHLADPVTVGSTLVHELVHASVGCEHRHGPPFRKLALKVGLEGHMTRTFAGPKLTAYLKAAAAQIGPLPLTQDIRLVEMDVASVAGVIARKQVESVYPRWFYHRVTRECRIVHSDAEAAALDQWWWEWIEGRGRRW